MWWLLTVSTSQQPPVLRMRSTFQTSLFFCFFVCLNLFFTVEDALIRNFCKLLIMNKNLSDQNIFIDISVRITVVEIAASHSHAVCRPFGGSDLCNFFYFIFVQQNCLSHILLYPCHVNVTAPSSGPLRTHQESVPAQRSCQDSESPPSVRPRPNQSPRCHRSWSSDHWREWMSWTEGKRDARYYL